MGLKAAFFVIGVQSRNNYIRLWNVRMLVVLLKKLFLAQKWNVVPQDLGLTIPSSYRRDILYNAYVRDKKH
jgi:hypothetical protein